MLETRISSPTLIPTLLVSLALLPPPLPPSPPPSLLVSLALLPPPLPPSPPPSLFLFFPLCCFSKSYILPFFLDIVNGTTTEKDGIYNVDKEMSYRCKSSRKYSMKTQPDLGKNGLTVELSNFQAQAFNFKNSTAGNFDKS